MYLNIALVYIYIAQQDMYIYIRRCYNSSVLTIEFVHYIYSCRGIQNKTMVTYIYKDGPKTLKIGSFRDFLPYY